MPAPLLSTRVLNRTLLARQLWLERATMNNVTAPTFLVDGFVPGIWKPVGKDGATAIELRAIRNLSAAHRCEVDSEASSLIAMLELHADPGAVRWRRAA